MNSTDSRVGRTGGTGYIGGRLLPLIESRTARLRCLSRRPESLSTPFSESTQVVQADVLDLVRQSRHLPARDIHVALHRAITEFRGQHEPLDDMTTMVIKAH